MRIGCYDSADGGYFRAHRDNTTPYTAHRQFAMSVNLNTGEYEGGDVHFPEYGRQHPSSHISDTQGLMYTEQSRLS